MTIKVVVLYSKSLFAAGIEKRLSRIEDFQVIHIDASTNDPLPLIDAARPDVLIVDVVEENPVCKAIVLQVLKQSHAPLVVSLDLNHTEISIYQRSGHQVMNGDDLVSAIREQLRR